MSSGFLNNWKQAEPRIQRQKTARRGFILVPVLLLGVVFISCATAFTWFSRLQIKTVLREKSSLENRSMAQTLALSVIAGLKANTMVKYDSPTLSWFKPFFFPADALGTWAVRITPLDDKIPIRGLFLPDGNTLRNELRKTWEDLWVKLEKRDMAHVVLDFLDKDARPRMGGAERENYLNRPLLDMSELLILDEMTPELLYGAAAEEKLGLADYCTLWSDGKINLNVAPVHVMEILPGLDRALAEKIAEYREKEALKTTSALRDIPGFPARAISTLMNLAAVSSRYFALKIEMLEDTGGGTGFNVIFDKTSGKILRWEEN
jgi:type II secretory pathway component PulK